MRIVTARFGCIDINEASVIDAPEGLLGFEYCRRLVLLEDRPNSHFKWLQAVDHPEVAFIVINPMEFFPDYEVLLTDEHAESLRLEDAADAVMFTTVTVVRDKEHVTTDLAGPIVINARILRARQIVLDDERYGPRHVIGQSPARLAQEPIAA
ncbi:MAG: flagellar assembly protein FliW [Armatimonadota bacterium]|nr:flagellar assembly protein FliW [Armatimonadota bacterium]